MLSCNKNKKTTSQENKNWVTKGIKILCLKKKENIFITPQTYKKKSRIIIGDIYYITKY